MNESNQPGLAPDQKLGQGRFTLVRKLGEGGMGMVWLAKDDRLGEPVALKFVPTLIKADVEALESLRKETIRARILSHPNILRIHDFHHEPDEPAFVSMEYVQGKNLGELRHEQPDDLLSWAVLAPLVQQLCEALDYAHGEGVIHRDLKPANLMLDAKGRLKLADFGIAAVMSESQSRVTGQSSTSGTVAYMSPQQMTGKTPKPSDDIYALGATLYHLLTSRPPFYQGSITHQVLSTPPTPIPARLNELGIKKVVPPKVCAVVLACLEKEPEQRPVNAKAVWKRLEHVTFGLTVGPVLERTPLARPSVEAIPEPVQVPDEPEILPPTAHRPWPVYLLIITVLALAGWGLTKLFKPTDTQQAETMKPDDHTQQGRAARRDDNAAMETASKTINASKESPWTNSLGMAFAPVPGTKVLFGIWATRVKDYAAYAKANKGVDASWENPEFKGQKVTPDVNCPVVNVSWEDAKAFCAWLTRQDQAAGMLVRDQQYRLPTDEEWSVAVGLPRETGNTPMDKDKGLRSVYPWGTQWPPPRGAGNYLKSFGVDDFAYTSPVGSFKANAFGLYDMGGNVWQWCEDWFDTDQKTRVLRGGSWHDVNEVGLRSSCRGAYTPGRRNYYYGFRVVLAGAIEQPTAKLPAVQANLARATKENPWTNSLGMKFVPVPGTKVLFSIWETRVQDLAAFAQDRANNGAWNYQSGTEPFILKSDENKQRGWDYGWNKPGFTQTLDHPVTCVSWEDAQAFCVWLTKQDQAAGILDHDQQYRLPTDAEWSQAVGLPNEENRSPKDKNVKIADVYPWGTQWPPPQGAGNYAGSEAKDADWPNNFGIIEGYRDGFARTAPVGSFAPNKLGLFDLSGNVWEWCEDWYDTDQKYRVLRGGGWRGDESAEMLSSRRGGLTPGDRYGTRGFRVVLVVGGSKP